MITLNSLHNHTFSTKIAITVNQKNQLQSDTGHGHNLHLMSLHWSSTR